MKKWIGIIVLILMTGWIVPAWSNSAAPLTLNQAVLEALAFHPAIRADKMAYQAQKAATRNVRSGLLPSIDLTSDSGYERVHNSLARSRQAIGADSDDYRDLWTNTQTLSVIQLIHDGDMTKSKYLAQTHRTESSRILVQGSADEIALRTIESYMDVLRARKTIRLAEDNILDLEALAEKTRMRLDSGKGTITDVNRVQLTLSDARSNRINHQGRLEYAKDLFKALTGKSPDLIARGQTINFDRIITTVEDAVDQAMEDNNALMTARSNIRQKEADLKTAKGLYHPKVNLILRGIREENCEALKDVDYTVSGLVRVDLNLFRGWGDQALIHENASRLAEARAREDEIRLDVETKIRYEFTNLKTANKKIWLLERKVEQNLKILESYQEQFLVGKRDILDVIEAQQMLFTFQAALEDVETEKNMVRFRLVTIMGSLFQTLDINFNPET